MTPRFGNGTAFISLALLSLSVGSLAFAEPFSKAPPIYRGSWNSYGEKCDKASGRNYLQDRAVTALHRFYDKNKIPKPVFVPYASDCPTCNQPTEKNGPISTEETTKFSALMDADGLQPYLGGGLADDIKCIHAAQKAYYGEGGIPDSKAVRHLNRPFLDCTSSKGGHSYDRAHPPCATPAYLELIARTLRSASYCTGLKKSEIAPLFAHESNFYPLARSGTGSGSAGLGQLTNIAIKEIRNQDAAVKDGTSVYPQLKETQGRIDSDPQCAIYRNLSLPRSISTSKCELMSFPNHPFLSTLTAMKLFVIFQSQVRGMFDQIPRDRFSPEERELLIRDATYYSYNGGTGVSSKFIAFIRNPKDCRGKALPSTASAEEIHSLFLKRVASRDDKKCLRITFPPGTPSPEVVANYVRGHRGVSRIADDLGKAKGGTCFAD